MPDRWQELSPLVDAVLDTPRERRSSILMEVSAGDRRLRAEIERLVDECERSVPMLDRPAAEGFSWLLVEDADAAIPEVLGGRYRIEREAGRGGMARVYLAHDLKHSRSVAVKVIRPDLAALLGRERFFREMEIAARLRHPNIVPLFDSGDTDGVLYFVMPYEEGPSLRSRLDRGDTLSLSECVSILRDIARALASAHEHGVVHRDVKPDNVMLSGGAAVVTDFGIAKAVSVAHGDARAVGTVTQTGAGTGTPAYMAPEQARGDSATDHRADIYSFGCLAYELFAGHPPFHDLPTHEIIAAHVGTKPVPLSEVTAGVPQSVTRLVARCLEKSPAARPQSAQELLAELEAAQLGPDEVVRRQRVRSRTVVVSSMIVGAVLIAAAGYLMSRGRAVSAAAAVNPEARRLYALGQRALTQRGQRIQASIDLFRRATELDPLYAEAFAGWSVALALAPYFEPISSREVSGQVRRAAQRALQLDPTLAPPHVALGLAHQFEYAWDSAAAELQTAVRLRNPDDIEPLVQYGRHWLYRGRTDSALKHLLTARLTEPASALVSSWLANTYYYQGQMDSARAESARAFQNDSMNYTALSIGTMIRLRAGDSVGARDLASRLLPLRAEALYAFAAMGDTAIALGRLREFERERPTRWLAQTNRAYVMFGIGDTTAAMAALERAVDAHELWPAYGSVLDPMYDPVRSSAWFHALLRRVNLPLSPAILGRWPQTR